jgi:hypothetical protein
MNHQEALDRHKAVLAPATGDTEGQLWAKAADFTNRVCYDLREQGWRRIVKPGGQNCGGLNCDLICNEATREMRDVVGAAGSIKQAPAWIDKGFDAPRNLALQMPTPYGAPAPQPQPEPGPAPTPTPAPAPVACTCKADLERVTSALVALTNTVASQASVLAGLNERLDEEWAARVWTGTDPEKLPVVLPEPPVYQGRVLGTTITLRPVK